MPREFDTGPAPHWPAATTVRGVMLKVLVALVPGIVALAVLQGPAVLVQIALAVMFALVVEAVMLRMRGVPVRPFLLDGSAVVTAVLFALCIPPWTPWWVAAVGMVAAIALAKQVYGGIGYNVFNPAMVGYAVVLIAFTAELSAWPGAAGTAEQLARIVDGGVAIDAIAQATPLDALREGTGQSRTVAESLAGHDWTAALVLAVAWLVGGIYLIATRATHWHAPAGMLVGVFVTAAILGWYDDGRHAGAIFHLVHGATVFAAFFIVTDPVSGCTTPRGRLWFGIGAGVFTVLIRSFGAYPDGVAFAVLLMNGAAPLIDRWSRPRVYGTGA
jgi:electron transport complex protein RnfD